MQISYSKDRKQDGVYNIRVIGKNAAGLSGQTVTVGTANGSSKQEALGKCFWNGIGDDGVEVALYAKANAGAPQGGNGDLERRLQAVEAQLKSLLAIMHSGKKSPAPIPDEDLPF